MIEEKLNNPQPNSEMQSQKVEVEEYVKKSRHSRRRYFTRKAGRNCRKKEKKEVENYIDSKMCENCLGQQNEQNLLLCDRCDDSYHAYCLVPPLEQLPETDWLCDICINQLKELEQTKSKGKENQTDDKDCFECKKPLSELPSINGVNEHGNEMQVQLKSLSNIKCLYCKKTFHNPCFSHRKNSLNCWTCQKSIRSSFDMNIEKGPKCHDDFMMWIEDCIKSVKNSECKFQTIQNLQEENDESLERHRYFRLKVPSYMTTWQSIVENEASIYYSFKTKGLTFIDDQLYEKESFQSMMNMNKPIKDINGPIPRLHKTDQSTYEQFKINSQKGYVGPFEVRQDRVKGFYLIASEFIEPLTIVSEYVGQVKTARVALNFEENDSIFLLVRSARSAESLDIVPQLYGNISRFFLGINNEYKRIHGATKLENVKSLRFSYKGRVRLLLYTSKPIQAGETLYFNYNGSAFHEYPTDHFVT